MKKVISLFNIVFLLMLMLTACSQKAENKINSVENPPFTEEITLYKGQEKQGYFIVFSNGDFRLDEIEFKNKNEDVAKLSFLKIEKQHYVFYTVEALEEGETYIWFETKDAAISSSMIKVSVVEKSVQVSESITEAETGSTIEVEVNIGITENAVGIGSYINSATVSSTDNSENVGDTTAKAESPFDTTKHSEETITGETAAKETEPQALSGRDIVYISPTGKRYHLRETCAGKNAIKTTFGDAKDILTPCKKCAGG